MYRVSNPIFTAKELSEYLAYLRTDMGPTNGRYQEHSTNLKIYIMLKWTVIFVVLAIIAAIFGFGGIAAGAASIAKVLFFIFVVLFIISLFMGRKKVV